jgi:hypothetical protein
MLTRRRLLRAGGAGALLAPVLLPRSANAVEGGSLVTLLTAARVYDSRESPGPFNFNGRKLQPGDAPNISVGPAVGGGATLAVFLNVTVTETESSGFLTLVPTDLSGERPLPFTSNINWWEDGQTIGNASLVAVGGENSIEVHVRGGSAGRPPRAHVIIDVQGYVPYSA